MLNRLILSALFLVQALAPDLIKTAYADPVEFNPRFGLLERPPEDLKKYEQQQREEQKQVPRMIPTYFTRFRPDLRRLCEAVIQDGRREALYALLSPHTLRDENCFACMPFFKEFSSACRPKEQVVKAGATPAPEIFKQREPDVLVIEAATRAFSKIAAEEVQMPLIIQAIEKLMTALKNPENKTRAEQEYFSTLSEFIYVPFLPYVRRVEQEKKESEPKLGSPQGNKRDLDDLFAF